MVQAVLAGAAGTQSSPYTRRILGKFNFWVDTRGIYEGREVEGMEEARTPFKRDEGSPTLQM